MEDLDKDEDSSTPFWVQSTTSTGRADRLRHRLSSFFLSSGLVVFILLVTAVFFLLFILPTTLSFTSQIFRPNSVKKSWDSLNIVLVLVAVVFGLLSRIKNEDCYDSQSTPSNKQIEPLKPKTGLSGQSDQWFSYGNSTAEVLKPNVVIAAAVDDATTSFRNWYNDDSFMKRNSSSYPDLREFSSSRWDFGPYPRGFYDDLYRGTDPVKPNHRRHRSVEEVDIMRAVSRADKPIFAMDTLVENRSIEEGKPTTVSSPNRQPANLRHRRHRSVEEVDTLRSIPRAAKDTLVANLSNEEGKVTKVSSQVPDDIRQLETLRHRRHRSVEEINTLSAIPKGSKTMFVDTLVVNQNQHKEGSRTSYPKPTPPENQNHERVVRRKGRKNKKSMEEPAPQPEFKDEEIADSNVETLVPDRDWVTGATKEDEWQPNSSNIKRTGSGSATKDFFNSLYHKKKKKQRQKSVDSVDTLLHQSQDPLNINLPPAPPSTVFQNLFLTKKQKRKRTISVTLTPSSPPPPPPPPPPRTVGMLPNNTVKEMKMEMFEGNAPLSRIPQPPPPPPPAFLKNPAWKFVVQGDYVRVDSSSGCSEMNGVDSDVTPSAEEGVATPFQAASPLYCPSPDVNSKAESFISSFRAKLKLEKIHSMNGRQLGLSGLGPELGPSRN